MGFVNRVTELSLLRRWWEREYPRPAIVWGRRRVGKTALLREFTRGLRTVFHTGAGRAASDELAQLTQQAAAAGLHRTAGLERAPDRPYQNWDEALDELARAAAQEPALLVLDEFPELVLTSPELPGVLRAFLDRSHGQTNLRVLLCGSAVRHMEAIQEHRAPLYGRFDLTLMVHPFTPSEAALMLPDLPPAQRAAAYGLLGGVPLYLSWWDQQASVVDNLRDLVCRPAAPLLIEGQLVLATEVERGELPSAVLHAIAAGRTRHSEIKDAVRAEPSRTLDRLLELRLIERLFPVTETERSRRRIYRITDNFLNFYLRQVEPLLPEIERGMGASILPAIMEALDDHLGQPWEATFRDHIRRLAATGDIGEQVVAVGPFWTETGAEEIDAVALAGRARKPIFAGEAKWTKELVAGRVLARLQRKTEALPGGGADVTLAICARERVRGLPSGVWEVTAADIFPTP